MNTGAKNQPFRSPKAAAATQNPNSSVKRPSTALMPQRHQMISEAAYYVAEHRGFEPGHEVEDWLLAESQIDVSRRGVGLPPANQS